MKKVRIDPTPSEIPRTTGSVNVTHDANNMSGSSYGHVNRDGNSIPGRTSDKTRSLKADEVARAQNKRRTRD